MLEHLCNMIGVAGYEKPVRDYILSKIKGHGDSIEVDALGNIIVFKKRINLKTEQISTIKTKIIITIINIQVLKEVPMFKYSNTNKRYYTLDYFYKHKFKITYK